MTKTCIDLFAGLGGFSSAFEESDDWDVFTVDIEEEFDPDLVADMMDVRPEDLPDAEVVVISVPCTVFSTAGNHDQWDGRRPVGDRAKENIALVYHALGLVLSIDPTFWFLENPRGRLRWFLGEPEGTVTYCQYGRDYMKPTDLWGVHPSSMEYKSCTAGSDCHTANGEDDGTSAIASMPDDVAQRSLVPEELSAAILDAVEHEIHSPEPQQTELWEVVGV